MPENGGMIATRQTQCNVKKWVYCPLKNPLIVESDTLKQECIPVGCVLTVYRSLLPGGVLSHRGVYLVPGESAPKGGGICSGGSAPGGSLLQRGVCSGGVSAGQVPPLWSRPPREQNS